MIWLNNRSDAKHYQKISSKKTKYEDLEQVEQNANCLSVEF